MSTLRLMAIQTIAILAVATFSGEQAEAVDFNGSSIRVEAGDQVYRYSGKEQKTIVVYADGKAVYVHATTLGTAKACEKKLKAALASGRTVSVNAHAFSTSANWYGHRAIVFSYVTACR